jgi:hypothetical protein
MRRSILAVALTGLFAAAGWLVCPRGGAPVTPSSPEPQPVLPPPSAAPGRPMRGPAGAAAPANAPARTNLYERCRQGDLPKPSREQLEPFVARHRRSAEALLGALRASGDREFLKEAREKYPDDPRVQFAAAYQTESAEERRQWLEKFKQSAPENALGCYLVAGEEFKAGRPEAAMQELAAAAGRPEFENYLRDFVQNAEEAYRAGGCAEAEAKAAAMTGALLPELAPLKQLALDMVDLAKRYDQAGDAPSAAALRELGLGLGHRLDQSQPVPLLNPLVGVAIERLMLDTMNPEVVYAESGQTVQGRVDELKAGRKEIRGLVESAESSLRTMSDADLAHFFDRVKLYGEIAAMRWVVQQGPTP